MLDDQEFIGANNDYLKILSKVVVSFHSKELKEYFEANGILFKKKERSLLYLHDIKAIVLEKGMP